MKRWIVAGIVALALVVVGAYAVRYYSADVRGRIDANETIKSGANRIAQYDYFFALCAAVQDAEAALAAQQALLSVDPEDKRVLANIAGITAARASLINEYNVRAAREYTSGQFRDSELPYQLSAAAERTTCV